MPLYILDLAGVFAFSVYGAYVAHKKGFDIFGIFVCAILTALGGGTIREMILNKVPSYFFDYTYFYAILIGVFFSILTYKNFNKIDKYMLIMDAIGLATFAFIGAQHAYEAGLGFLGIVLFAVITPLGGGMLRDVLVREIPKTLYQDFYATPCIILGVLFYTFQSYMQYQPAAYALILFIFFIRVIAIYLKANLWAPFRSHSKKSNR